MEQFLRGEQGQVRDLGAFHTLALLIILLPIRRAVRFRPGDALRYA